MQLNEHDEDVGTDTTAPIVILTKHCTVRLNRLANLDSMKDVSTFYLGPINPPNNHIIDNNMVNE